MPTDFTTTFGYGDTIQDTHVSQYASPVNQLETGASYYAEDAGSTDSYAVTLAPVPDAYTAGMMVNFKANTANTGAATLNCNGLGAQAIKKHGSAALDTGDIAAGQIVAVIYDGTNFQMQTAAASAANLDDLADVNAPSPSDGDLLSFDSGTSKWVPRGGNLDSVSDVDASSPSDGDVLHYSSGSGHWESGPPVTAPFYPPDVPPSTPDPADDEFSGASLDTAGTRFSGAIAWAWRNQGGATATLADGFLTLTAPGASSQNNRIIEQVAATAPWTYRAKLFDPFMTESNFALAGMVLVNSTTGKLIAFSKAYISGLVLAVSHYDNVTTFSSGTNLAVFASRSFHGPLYLEIENDGTNLTFRYSDTGLDGTFITHSTETVASYLGSADTIGFFGNSLNSDPVKTIVEWFRRIA